MLAFKFKKARTTRTKQPTSKSAQIVASMDDLLIEILLLLPIKSLICFKSVSKHWLSLITNPQFSLTRNPNPNPAIGIFFSRTYIKPRFDYARFDTQNPTKLPFKKLEFNKDTATILQSCNGLMLCSSYRTRDSKRNYYVYNPTTKHYTTLPKSVLGTGNSKIHGVSLAFDPAVSAHYKVVCVRDSVSVAHHYQIEIYSSETGPWRLSGDPFMADVNFRNGVYWNGAIHWINTWRSLSPLCFNVDLEKLGVMPMPPLTDEREGRCTSYFGESCGHLHLIETCCPQIQFSVYEMKRDYSEWFVKYKVDIESLVTSFPGMINTYHDHNDFNYYNFTIFALVRGKREEDAFLVLGIPGDRKAICYFLVSKTFKKLCDNEGEDEQNYSSFLGGAGAFEYIESLCCV